MTDTTSMPAQTQSSSMTVHEPISVVEWDIAEKAVAIINGYSSPGSGDSAAKMITTDPPIAQSNDNKILAARGDVSAGLHSRSQTRHLSVPDSNFASSSQNTRNDVPSRYSSVSEISHSQRKEIKHGPGKQTPDRNDNLSISGSARTRETDYRTPTFYHAFWIVNVYGQSRKMSHKLVTHHKQTTHLGLLQNSLVPLTDQLPAAKIELIEHQAAKFCGIFVSSAQWYLNVDNLPPHVGALIGGVTADSRKTDIGSQFMRFRFPHIFFEVSIISPLTPSETTRGNKSSIAIWRAWAKGGANQGLVAYGKVYDEISVDFRISRRYFEVIQVFQPEIFRPVPYPRDPAITAGRNDFLVFWMSWTMIQFLRRSRSIMAFLVTLSALLAALQPVISQFSPPAGWVLAGAGILSGLVSIRALFVSWILGYVESHASQQRHYRPERPFV